MVDQTITTVFNQIYDTTNKHVLVYITAKCGNPSDISDIFQETYTELFSVLSRRGTNYIENSQAFMIKLAKQKIYRHYTLLDKVKQRIAINKKDVDFVDSATIEQFDFAIEEHMVDEQLLEEINQYLQQKSALIAKIFYLYYSLELTIAQIAKELNLTESSVKNKLYRTLAELKTTFESKR